MGKILTAPINWALQTFGPAGILIAVPYFIAMVAVFSAITIGLVWGSVVALMYIIAG